jgi:FtsZ-binding cell division protein ZapB
MFNRKLEEAIENLYDSIYLLSEEVKEIREEVDYLLEVLDND